MANYLLSSETVFPVFVWILSSIMTQLSKGKKNWFDWKWHLATVVCVIFLIETIGHKPQREWRKIQKEQIFITFWLWCSFFFFPVACADPIWRCNFRLMPKLYLLAEHFWWFFLPAPWCLAYLDQRGLPALWLQWALQSCVGAAASPNLVREQPGQSALASKCQRSHRLVDLGRGTSALACWMPAWVSEL